MGHTDWKGWPLHVLSTNNHSSFSSVFFRLTEHPYCTAWGECWVSLRWVELYIPLGLCYLMCPWPGWACSVQQLHIFVLLIFSGSCKYQGPGSKWKAAEGDIQGSRPKWALPWKAVWNWPEHLSIHWTMAYLFHCSAISGSLLLLTQNSILEKALTSFMIKEPPLQQTQGRWWLLVTAVHWQ